MKQIAALWAWLALLITTGACSGSTVSVPNTCVVTSSPAPTNLPVVQVTEEIEAATPKTFRPIAEMEFDIIFQISFAAEPEPQPF